MAATLSLHEVSAKQKKALAWTLGVHVIILLLLLLWKYSPPAQTPVPELGMEVNLGTDADGFGSDQPEAMGDPAPRSTTSRAATTAGGVTGTQSASTVTQDGDEAVNTPTTARGNTTRPNTRVNTSPSQAAPAAAAKYTYDGASGTGGNAAQQNTPGGSEGNTTGDGDRGVPSGTPGASNYTGSPGRGTGGFNHDLRDRNIIAPQLIAEFRSGGSVVLRVTVNRNGDITDSRILSASNPELRAIALDKIKGVRFSKKPDAPVEQFGKITIVFRAR